MSSCSEGGFGIFFPFLTGLGVADFARILVCFIEHSLWVSESDHRLPSWFFALDHRLYRIE
ncbi:MAG: hypothetical protein CL917_11735 [Deltaproteobacteria bacterium]|nr:hypothetical protein [Deltaproteobacteria bacterium]